MKTKVTVELAWRHCFNDEKPNTYEAVAGSYSATVVGKNYYIYKYGPKLLDFGEIYTAKARSNKDAFSRATNKLAKLAMSDASPGQDFVFSLSK